MRPATVRQAKDVYDLDRTACGSRHADLPIGPSNGSLLEMLGLDARTVREPRAPVALPPQSLDTAAPSEFNRFGEKGRAQIRTGEGMRIDEFEEAVWALERVRIVVRTSPEEEVQEYSYSAPERENRSWAWLRDNRIQNLVGLDHWVVAIDGTGQVVDGRMGLRRLRASYPRD